MSQALSQIYLHIVFSTARRQKILHSDLLPGLLQTFRNQGRRRDCPVLRVNAVEDHVHLLVQLARDITVSDLVKHFKLGAVVYLKSKSVATATPGTYWQPGYAAFSVSKSLLPIVSTYIDNQQSHHSKKSFQEEYLALLHAHQVDYDQARLWT